MPAPFVLIKNRGGGKTTLMKIMMGLFDPIHGQVMIGSKRLSTISKQAFRSGIGSVAQDDSLYGGSLAENISFFDPELDMERIQTVSKQAHIHDDIMAMPLGYETLVGDMGSVLSGGQLQFEEQIYGGRDGRKRFKSWLTQYTQNFKAPPKDVFIFGELDEIAPVSALPKTIADVSTITIIPKTGHQFIAAKPEVREQVFNSLTTP